jgi:hypothetical protein
MAAWKSRRHIELLSTEDAQPSKSAEGVCEWPVFGSKMWMPSGFAARGPAAI